MSLDETLKKVEEDLTSGDLGKARDRLHSLIYAYPNNLELRRKLGYIYWELHFPAMAGRYWYLEKNKSHDMLRACEKFENECGKNPFIILRSLKFRGDISLLDEFERDIISSLKERAKAAGYWNVHIANSTTEKIEASVAPTVIVIILIALLIFTGIGIVTVIQWLF